MKNQSLSNIFKKNESQTTGDSKSSSFQVSGAAPGSMAVFGPGLFLVVLGVVTVLAPGLILGIMATLLVFFGLLLCFFAWKFMQVKRNLEEAARRFQGSVQVHQMHMRDPFETEIVDEDDDEDCIIIH